MLRPALLAVSFSLLGGGLLASPAAAQAGDEDPALEADDDAPEAPSLEWTYPTFRPAEYVVGFGAPLVFRLIDHNTREASSARWTGPILIDEPMQDLLVPSSASGRNDVEIISDYLWYGSMALPLIDTLITPLLVHGNPYVTWQMMAINIAAYAVNGFVTLLSIRAAARERPAEVQCEDDPEYIELCGNGPLRSFPSGHTAGAFTGAGLYCAHHMALPLYGGGLPDTAACAAALTVASGVAILRVSAQRHYFSDVVIGAGIGLGAGWLLPWLLHYQYGPPSADELDEAEPPGLRATAMPWASGQGAGIDVFGFY